jgi:hypothetical protein
MFRGCVQLFLGLIAFVLLILLIPITMLWTFATSKETYVQLLNSQIIGEIQEMMLDSVSGQLDQSLAGTPDQLADPLQTAVVSEIQNTLTPDMIANVVTRNIGNMIDYLTGRETTAYLYLPKEALQGILLDLETTLPSMMVDSSIPSLPTCTPEQEYQLYQGNQSELTCLPSSFAGSGMLDSIDTSASEAEISAELERSFGALLSGEDNIPIEQVSPELAASLSQLAVYVQLAQIILLVAWAVEIFLFLLLLLLSRGNILSRMLPGLRIILLGSLIWAVLLLLTRLGLMALITQVMQESMLTATDPMSTEYIAKFGDISASMMFFFVDRALLVMGVCVLFSIFLMVVATIVNRILANKKKTIDTKPQLAYNGENKS